MNYRLKDIRSWFRSIGLRLRNVRGWLGDIGGRLRGVVNRLRDVRGRVGHIGRRLRGVVNRGAKNKSGKNWLNRADELSWSDKTGKESWPRAESLSTIIRPMNQHRSLF